MAERASQRTPAQNRQMWGLVTQLAKATGCSREEAQEALRACCVEVSGQDSSSRLTEAQAHQVIRMLEQRTPRQRPASERPSPPASAHARPGAITPRQQEVLLALFVQVKMTSREQQMGFCRRQFKLPWPQHNGHVDQLITPLKAMAIRHVTGAEMRQRALALRGDPGLDAWQVGFIADLLRQTVVEIHTPHKLLKLIEAEVACRRSEA